MLTEMKTVRWEITGQVGRLVINTPPANEMTTSFFHDLHNLVNEIEQNTSLKGLFIYGSGRHFSSGSDLPELLHLVTNSQDELLLQNRRTLRRIGDLPIPVIAIIRGVCIGSAMELALHCHFRFCSPDAVFGLPETSFNLMPGLGGIRKFVSIAGEGKAVELVLTGQTFDAVKAFELKLVDKIIHRDHLHFIAEDFMGRIGKNYIKGKKPLYLHRYFNNHDAVE